jgi:hypothetical protein
VVILAGIALYIIIVLAIVRTFQAVHTRDEEMRILTAEWIAESTPPPLRPGH